MEINRTFIRNNKIKSKTGKPRSIPVFSYTIKGVKCNPREIERIKKLGIPPNWTDVQISNSEISHLQATGKDEKQRTQYIYHPMWVLLTSHEKYERMGKFAKKIGKFESQIKSDLNSPDHKTRIIAIMFRILQKTHIRVGNECYAKDNNTYGLCTLESKHLRIKNKRIHLNFVGKKSVEQSVSFTDPNCFDYLIQFLNSKNQRLFEISPTSLNNYLQTITGGDFTCKDFRTYASNILFLKILCNFGIPSSQTEAKKNLKSTYDQVADKLGHTRAISKKSYVMGIIPEQYLLNPNQFSKKNPKVVFKHFTN